MGCCNSGCTGSGCRPSAAAVGHLPPEPGRQLHPPHLRARRSGRPAPPPEPGRPRQPARRRVPGGQGYTDPDMDAKPAPNPLAHGYTIPLRDFLTDLTVTFGIDPDTDPDGDQYIFALATRDGDHPVARGVAVP